MSGIILFLTTAISRVADKETFLLNSYFPNFFCYRASMSNALKQTTAPSLAIVMSTEEIRRCFPALARTHNGYPVAYFDGPGGTQVPRTVVEAMNDYLYQIGRASCRERVYVRM